MTKPFLSYNLFFFLSIFLLVASCSNTSEEMDQKNDVLLAQVFKKKLFASEIADMVPQSSSKEDSALIVNAFIDKWVKDNVLMNEAEKNIPNNLNIDELVRDYRASLVKHNYEKMIVELQLDSVITQEELNQYYEKNREHYKLESDIIRCHFIKIPLIAEGLDELKSLWETNTEDSHKTLIEYCQSNAEVFMLDDSTWYKLEDISFQLPKGILSSSNVKQIGTIGRQDENFQYYFRLLEHFPKNEYAPLGYIREQANKVILHQRKIKLLEEQKEQMYQRELRRNNVKIHTN